MLVQPVVWCFITLAYALCVVDDDLNGFDDYVFLYVEYLKNESSVRVFANRVRDDEQMNIFTPPVVS